jgi:hypothetical protein
MQTITTIGLDIAKSVFQVHGVDATGQAIIRRQLKRRYVIVFFQKLSPCLVGIEACASAHHWSRELQALGHTVRLMPPGPRRTISRTISAGVVGRISEDRRHDFNASERSGIRRKAGTRTQKRGGPREKPHAGADQSR